MFYNVVEFEKQIEREECCGVATKNQIECTIMENREVAGERDNIATYSQSSIELYYLLEALSPEFRKTFIYQIKHLLSEE